MPFTEIIFQNIFLGDNGFFVVKNSFILRVQWLKAFSPTLSRAPALLFSVESAFSLSGASYPSHCWCLPTASKLEEVLQIPKAKSYLTINNCEKTIHPILYFLPG